MKRVISASAIALFATTVQAASEMPSMEEMWRIIQAQSAEIADLKKNAVQQEQQISTTMVRVEQNEQKVEATADVIEQQADSGIAKLAEWANKTTIGGYGEHHYNQFDDKDDQVDAHRFVIYFGHQFTDKVRMFSELEVEHGFVSGDDDSPGEVELEQAYIEWDYTEGHRVQFGQFLVPVGILNETHEPDTFYGIERNNVEKNIIPTTWWETGVQLLGEVAPGLSYNLGLHSGLEMDVMDGVRSGRQKSAKATAEDLALTGRLKYTAIQGLELASTIHYQEDVTQGNDALATEDASATLLELHAAYQSGPFAVRALWASWDIDSDDFEKNGSDEQEGWFVEPSYRITPKLGVFARYSEWDNQAGTNLDTEFEQWDIGFNYWLTPTVVLKADYSDQEKDGDDNGNDAFSLGVGWSF